MTETFNTGKAVIGVNMVYAGDRETRGLFGDIFDNYYVNHHYPEEILASGGVPMLIPPVEDETILNLYLDHVDAFLFIGGTDYPPEWYGEEPHPKNAYKNKERPSCDYLLMRGALERKMPILGICNGAQLLSVLRGGKLIQHIENAEKHTLEKYHGAEIRGGKILKNLLDKDVFEVNSAHHQAVDPDCPGEGIVISAVADDGTVEAIEEKGEIFRLGLQFHIERHKNKNFRRKVFDEFVCRASKNKRGVE